MRKILVQIINDCIEFSVSNDNCGEDYNKTNIFDVKKIKLSEDFISSNELQVANFINILASEFNKVIITDSKISETILSFLKYVPNVSKIYFSYDKTLTYTECSLLLENRNLNLINCYSMPEYLFDRFDILKKVIVEVRSEVFHVSDFMKINELKTYSDIYYKKKIVINEKLSYNDIKDFLDFLKINMFLKKIELISYDYDNLMFLLGLLRKNGVKNINIILIQDDDNKNKLLFDSVNFNKIEKEYFVKIKIKYSDNYKKDNYIKQVNINLLKFISVNLVILSIVFCFFNYILFEKNNKKLENINSSLEEIYNDSKEFNKIMLSENVIVSEKIDEVETIIAPNAQNSFSDGREIYFNNYSQVFNKLYEINSDTVGYLKVNNTNVNYPVVQSSDNDYYLNHDFDRRINSLGWIFMDYRNSVNILDHNTIIYGHNISRDRLLFGSLRNTLDEKWYKSKENQKIVFNIGDKDINWQIFSIYVVDVTNDYLITNFSSVENFNDFIKKIISRSKYDFGIEVKWGDNILTLSTCYNDDSQRIVIHAKKID